jgi:maleylacetate reductase
MTSGINAIAHAAEGLYAHDGNPIMNLWAEEGIAALGRALPRIKQDPNNIEARSDALYGAWLCGSVLGHVGMSLHHKLCHTLGGTLNLLHAETHTIVLPHALAYNAAHAPQAMQSIAKALGAEDAPMALYHLALSNGASVALKDLGMVESDIDRVCQLAMQNQYPNPRPLEQVALRQLLHNAYEGKPPHS